MENYILLTTGFLVPNNSYFTLVGKEENTIKEFFNRTTAKVINNEVLDFFKNNEVYTSNTINEAYKDYISNKNFDNFIKLLDIALDIFKDTDFYEFIKLQLTNKYLTNISLQFCMDLYTGKFFESHSSYFVIPSNVRFTLDNKNTKNEILNKLNEIDKNKKDFIGFKKFVSISNWTILFNMLMTNKEAFETFFKYIFVDVDIV